MALLNKIFITLCALCLMALALDIVIVGTLSTPDAANQTLEKSGVYSALAPSVAEVFIKDIKSNNVGGDDLVIAVRQAIKPEVVEASLQPVVFAISDWLKKPSDTAVPELTVDMLPIKTSLTSELSKTLPAEQVDSVRFEITKSVPDSLKLSELSQNSSPDGVAKDNIAGPLQEIKSSYQAAGQYQLLIGIAALLLLIVIGLINFRRGRKKLTSPGWAFLVAAVMGLVVSFGMPAVISLFTPNPAAKDSTFNPVTLILGVSRVISSGLWTYIILYSVIGLGLIVTAHIIIHPKDKKH